MRWLEPVSLTFALSLCAEAQTVGNLRQAVQSPTKRAGPAFELDEVTHGFGQLLPHRVFELDAFGQPTANVLEVRDLDVLIDNLTPSSGVLPSVQWPMTGSLPDGSPGNHFYAALFTSPIEIDSVLSSSVTAPSGLNGALTVLAMDPVSGITIPVSGRAFVGGKTYGAPDPANPGLRLLETWVTLDGAGRPRAAIVGGGQPGLGFPGTEDLSPFFGSGRFVEDRAFVFVVDNDDDLTTHEEFPVGFHVQLVGLDSISGTSGIALGKRLRASSVVGADFLVPEVALSGGPQSPVIVPGNGDVNVDPESNVIVQFTEPVQPLTVGDLPDGTPPGPSASIALQITGTGTPVPFTARPANPYDLSRYVLDPSFAFPGSGGASCALTGQVDIAVNASSFTDLVGNANLLATSTFFVTGVGPGLVNAPVTPDAIYLARFDGEASLSVLDLNGFGAGTGNPTYDFTNPVTAGNSNYPNNPNVSLQGSLLVPPLAPGQCTYDGGSEGVFTLTKDSSLDDRVARSPLIASVGDMAIGRPLDLTFNNAAPFGCQSGGGNICSSSGLKLVRIAQAGPTTSGPAAMGAPALSSLFGQGNLAAWAPHPNPPPLVFPPLCLSPLIGGQEPTSIQSSLPQPLGAGLTNLLAPGANYLGDPSAGIPPTSLLAQEQNAWFEGPSPPQQTISNCQTFMMRQQIGQFLYVVDRVTQEVVVFNSNRFFVLDRIQLPDPTSLAMSPNVDFLAITSEAGNAVHFLDINPSSSSFHQIVKVTPVGVGPTGVAWDPGNEDVLVCNTGDDTLSIVSAFDLNVRKTVGALPGGGSLNQPLDVAITPRQVGFGFQRNTYFAYVIDVSGQLALFESGPDGINGWGYDDLIGVAPFPVLNPKAIQPDLKNLQSAVWIAHEESLAPDGTPSGLSEGAVTQVALTATGFGQIPLDPATIGMPQLRGLGFAVARSVGGSVLTGVPTDLAFDDQRNVTSLQNRFSAFSAGAPLAANGKGLAKIFGNQIVSVSTPALLFVAIPSSTEGPGVVDVLDLAAGLARVDTSPYLPGVQSVPASGLTGLAGYMRQ